MKNLFIFQLKKLRNEKGLTQEELGDALELSRSAITKYETGERQPDMETLEKIADFFGVSLDYLVKGKEHATEPIKDAEDEVFEVDLVAEMESEYGNKPSPELVAMAKRVYKKVLNEMTKEEKKNNDD